MPNHKISIPSIYWRPVSKAPFSSYLKLFPVRNLIIKETSQEKPVLKPFLGKLSRQMFHFFQIYSHSKILFWKYANSYQNYSLRITINFCFCKQFLSQWLNDHFYNVMNINYDVITFNSKYLCLRRPGVATFFHIIKIVTLFFKTIFIDSKKV